MLKNFLQSVMGGSAGKVFSPVKGKSLPINKSADPAHQQEALGKGACLMPEGGKIFAPFNGIVDMIFETKHAINLKSEDGIELLIHCGIDTVKLRGKGFTIHVQEGEKIKTGQLLSEYDKNIITSAGYSLETQVVVTNTGDFKAVTLEKTGACEAGDLLLHVK